MQNKLAKEIYTKYNTERLDLINKKYANGTLTLEEISRLQDLNELCVILRPLIDDWREWNDWIPLFW